MKQTQERRMAMAGAVGEFDFNGDVLKTKGQNLYSINYESKRLGYESYSTFAVDWDGVEWKRSVREGVRWYPEGDLDQGAYQAILKHFGLENWDAEFPIHEIANMSPRLLAAERRAKEEKWGLVPKKMVSDTIGAHIPAEEWGRW